MGKAFSKFKIIQKNKNQMKAHILTVICLLLATSLFAQRGRGYYKPNKHYSYNRIAVAVRPRYSYRPYYRPVPVYRPVATPIFRSSRAFIHFRPVFGLRVNMLPPGYNRFYVGPNPFYYNNGVYYRQYPRGGYEVVAPPLNALVNNLPANATVTIIDGQKYYQVGGTFYQEEITANNKLRYRVVGTDGVLSTTDEYVVQNADLDTVHDEIPVLGDRYEALPGDAKVQVINQKKYFVTTGGVYYKEVIENNQILYEVTTVE